VADVNNENSFLNELDKFRANEEVKFSLKSDLVVSLGSHNYVNFQLF